MTKGRSATLRLREPILVIIAYFTAVVRDGRVHFFPDIYGAILEKVVAACQRHGKVAAIPCAPEQGKSYHAMGFRFFNVISDFRCVSTGMKAARAAVELS